MTNETTIKPKLATKIDLEEELAFFTGTETYHHNFLGLMFTDGVKYLAERVGAYWLIDAIASWQPEVRKIEPEFQLWELAVNEDSSAVLTARRDTHLPVIASQKIPYTDFPPPGISLYVEGNVLLLPSEH
jgi:hypothetical protein